MYNLQKNIAGEKKSKNKVYFVGQYNNNPKVYINFVGQYFNRYFSLGPELSNVQSFNKSLKEWNNKTVLFF